MRYFNINHNEHEGIFCVNTATRELDCYKGSYVITPLPHETYKLQLPKEKNSLDILIMIDENCIVHPITQADVTEISEAVARERKSFDLEATQVL